VDADAVVLIGKIQIVPPIRAKEQTYRAGVDLFNTQRHFIGRAVLFELLFPAPIEFDVRPGDAAVYVGTLRLYRDEFHEVTKAEVRDDYAQAAAQFREKFPGAPLPRKALLKPAKR
jgi:hypothetical protein